MHLPAIVQRQQHLFHTSVHSVQFCLYHWIRLSASSVSRLYKLSWTITLWGKLTVNECHWASCFCTFETSLFNLSSCIFPFHSICFCLLLLLLLESVVEVVWINVARLRLGEVISFLFDKYSCISSATRFSFSGWWSLIQIFMSLGRLINRSFTNTLSMSWCEPSSGVNQHWWAYSLSWHSLLALDPWSILLHEMFFYWAQVSHQNVSVMLLSILYMLSTPSDIHTWL